MESRATQKETAYWHGFDIYREGGQLKQCRDGDERRGWWAALAAQSDFETQKINQREVKSVK